eukprot:GHVR01045847.1.p1 GENE.GHVR01045847.1~~GHVR01045847.1.p1  ORF type:complete len:318 (-),score=11.46 GHVR01045847.1:545-1498(-)
MSRIEDIDVKMEKPLDRSTCDIVWEDDGEPFLFIQTKKEINNKFFPLSQASICGVECLESHHRKNHVVIGYLKHGESFEFGILRRFNESVERRKYGYFHVRDIIFEDLTDSESSREFLHAVFPAQKFVKTEIYTAPNMYIPTRKIWLDTDRKFVYKVLPRRFKSENATTTSDMKDLSDHLDLKTDQPLKLETFLIKGHRVVKYNYVRESSNYGIQHVKDAVKLARWMLEGGFVHGDLRMPNIVPHLEEAKAGKCSVSFVDLETSGKSGNATFPFNLNVEAFQGYKGRLPVEGSLVTVEHDIMCLSLFLSQLGLNEDI